MLDAAQFNSIVFNNIFFLLSNFNKLKTLSKPSSWWSWSSSSSLGWGIVNCAFVMNSYSNSDTLLIIYVIRFEWKNAELMWHKQTLDREQDVNRYYYRCKHVMCDYKIHFGMVVMFCEMAGIWQIYIQQQQQLLRCKLRNENDYRNLYIRPNRMCKIFAAWFMRQHTHAQAHHNNFQWRKNVHYTEWSISHCNRSITHFI